MRDVRSDHQKSMVHIYCNSILAGRSRAPASHLSYQVTVADLASLSYTDFLHDVKSVTSNLEVIVSRILSEYVSDLSLLSKAVIKHIHKNKTYSP